MRAPAPAPAVTMRGLPMSAAALIVTSSASFRVATPANADLRVRWMEVFLGSS
jgi:hypothetical protein